MKVAANRSSCPADLADFLSNSNILPCLNIDSGKMSIQRKQSIRMFDHYKIAIEISPRGVRGVCGLLVIPRKYNGSVGRGIDGRSAGVGELHAMMWIPRPVCGGAVTIVRINKSIAGRLDRALEDKMTLGDTKIDAEGVTGGFWRKCYRRCS